ncbi:hypothetical protein FRX31_031144 [Thalictrum thalictroides]|uniref:DUF4283 domain-containing protein n=1 Tax=Thalictrum thalictroides TaxID=46969 RepID=A0A7J6V2M6_THATH|nr:hypothetical protein FRX31_031144 [Thalictrum thalictroides]
MGTVRYFKIQSKTFRLDFVGGSLDESQIQISEFGKKGSFKATISPGCAKWLGNILCDLISVEREEFRSWEIIDKGTPVVAVARENRAGEVLQVFFHGRRGTKQAKCICFPAGWARNGWKEMGKGLLGLVMPTSDLNSVMANTQGKKPLGKIQEVNKGLTVKCSSNALYPVAEVQAERAVANVQWWKQAMMCGSSNPFVDWEWVRAKIYNRFGGATLRVLDSGEAVVFLSNDADREELERLPPLEAEGCVIKFRRWTPVEGGLPYNKNLSKPYWLTLKGIPLHLRVKKVVESLAGICGEMMEIDEPSLNFGVSNQRVKIKSSDLLMIPRLIFLEERGYKFKIQVMVEANEQWEKSWLAAEKEKESENQGMEKADVAQSKGGKEVVSEEPVESSRSFAEVVSSSYGSLPPGFKDTPPIIQISNSQNLNLENRWSAFNCLEQEENSNSQQDEIWSPRDRSPGREEGSRAQDQTVSLEGVEMLQAQRQEKGSLDDKRPKERRYTPGPVSVPIRNGPKWGVFRPNRFGLGPNLPFKFAPTHRKFRMEKENCDPNPSQPQIQILKRATDKGKEKQREICSIEEEVFHTDERDLPAISTPIHGDAVEENILSDTEGARDPQEGGVDGSEGQEQRKRTVEALKRSLLRCKTGEDIDIWIRWLASPMAGLLGVDGENNTEIIDAMFKKFCKEGNLEFCQEDLFDDAPMDDPEELLRKFEGLKEFSDVD